ncbi:hypothetical protein [Gordonia amicalis]|uniref:hypothetical protein n=1 Tax=Gordonia amicalis TaxID=89053 RepID=UPI003A81032B
MDRATLSASFKLKSPTVTDFERLISSSAVVSRRPIDVPVLVWRRGDDWRRPSWALTKAGANAGRYSSGQSGDWWSAVVRLGGVLAMGSYGGKLRAERVDTKLGPMLVGSDDTAELFVDPKFLTHVQRSA